MLSGIAVGDREAARSVLDNIEHGFRLVAGREARLPPTSEGAP